MTRRILLSILFLLLCATSASPKWKEEEQQYLDDQFKAVQDQIQALATHVQSLNAQLVEMRQNQAQLQTVIIRQQRALQDLDQMLSSMRLGNEESFASLKTVINQLRAETQTSLGKLTGQPTQPLGGTTEVATAPRSAPTTPARQVPQGYITAVEGNNVIVDLGSAQGVQQGSKLAVYKATDPNTSVGVIEVIQVLDAGNSRARIVTMNTGVRPVFADIVRLE